MASPITSSLSRPWSHGSSSVNIVTPIGARHAGDVGAPEATLRAERVDDLADVFVDVAVGVGLARIARRPRELDRDIGVFRERQHLAQIGKGGIVLSGTARTTAAMMVN